MARAYQGTGRKKIDIKKIENKQHLKTTFTKRRKGLFKKVEQFCTTSGIDAAVFTFSPYGRAYAVGNPSVNSVIERFYAEDAVNIVLPSAAVEEVGEEANEESDSEFWWKKPAKDIAVCEIDQFRESLTDFKTNLIHRIEDMRRRTKAEMNLFV
ncbi:MADS-box transcription factor family protein [Euphorbia peplus]|nr:MADS-box transcription factor family protein [Euphorbia peplus]